MEVLVMAGGRGSRLGLPCEKPLTPLLGRPMVDWVLRSVFEAGFAWRVWACTSPHTPLTARHLEGLGVGLYEGVGDSYVWDMVRAIRGLRLGVTLVLPSDTPLIRPCTLRALLERYFELGAEALTLCAPLEGLEALGVRPEYSFGLGGVQVCPVGVSVVDGSKIALGGVPVREERFVWPFVWELLNVNGPRELDLAEKFLRGLVRLADKA